jgi:hypothetical protein
MTQIKQNGGNLGELRGRVTGLRPGDSPNRPADAAPTDGFFEMPVLGFRPGECITL